MKNIYNKLSHMTFKSNQIWTNLRHKDVGNQVRINTLASIHFYYYSKIKILLEWGLVQNHNSMIKTT